MAFARHEHPLHLADLGYGGSRYQQSGDGDAGYLDAGELAGGGAIGVSATRDIDALIALKAGYPTGD